MMNTCSDITYEPISCADLVYSNRKESVLLTRLYGKFYFLDGMYLGVITKIRKDFIVFVAKNRQTNEYQTVTFFISTKEHKFKVKQ